MRFSALAWTALALTAGCLRFGYEPEPSKLGGGIDSGLMRPDGGVSVPGPAAEGGGGSGGVGMDAAIGGAAARMDASDLPSAGGGSGSAAPDSGGKLDAGGPDAGTRDAGALDAGRVDSGTRDAGALDAATTDAGTTPSEVDPVWTQDCPGAPSVLFCDDFEDGLQKWNYPVHVRGSTARTTDQKHNGNYAFRASTSASTATVQSQAQLGVKAFAHRKAGDLWARYFYYLPSTVSLTQKFSSGVISEYEDPYLGFSVLIFPDGVGLESGGASRKVTTTTFPRNQWVCVEMHVQIHASLGLFEFFLDGAPIAALTDLDTLPDHGFTSFEIGVHYADFNQGAITVYADDVLLGTGRLGCN